MACFRTLYYHAAAGHQLMVTLRWALTSQRSSGTQLQAGIAARLAALGWSSVFAFSLRAATRPQVAPPERRAAWEEQTLSQGAFLLDVFHICRSGRPPAHDLLCF